ncbi:MAG: hypothetical protein A3D31_09160 [Candidatus Fluviicola riflensis]|nr:MAG: hypothetical protein CHH17_13570 [Candidatus Fluviicola riflensis]OGS77175.1 MAG: hypothetical protein A3D31_09160 [Candidatus Fluviicola riflensis]OGS82110.1 MAG: hypothetical protein A2724_18105 [Fluviicola sp. RIFCSPHIGHO2_01_FULL_43_53]OGS87804.1 MAG: hypothetical protein A3E30_15540 [Fluviicola sp. RIFCSPHIGHO2_12_FULL_43_24]
MKTILLSISMLMLLACGTKKIAGDGTGQTIKMKTEKELKASLGKSEMNSNPTKITGVSIKGNKITLSISYSGGCKDHLFDLVGDEAISKSLPPQRTVRLVHTGEPDHCKALILKELEFDITELAYKQEKGSEIILNIEGWKEPVKYIFE